MIDKNVLQVAEISSNSRNEIPKNHKIRPMNAMNRVTLRMQAANVRFLIEKEIY